MGCLLSEPTFGLGESIMWENDPEISGKKRKRSLIRPKVYLYEVCVSLFQFIYYYYYFYTNTYFTSAIFVAYITLGERSSASIGQENSSQRDTRRNMSG